MTVHVLEFTQPGCPACTAMEGIVRDVRAEFPSVAIDEYDAREYPANLYSVHGTPTFVFLDDAGNDVKHLVGVRTKKELEDAIVAAGGGAAAPVPTRPKYRVLQPAFDFSRITKKGSAPSPAPMTPAASSPRAAMTPSIETTASKPSSVKGSTVAVVAVASIGLAALFLL